MTGDIRTYARLGLVHHMLYPESVTNPALHARTLLEFIKRTDIETFDCCLPYGHPCRNGLVTAIRRCGKTDVVFAIHMFPMRRLPLAALLPAEKTEVRRIIGGMVEQAAAIRATGFIFGSGRPPLGEATPAHIAAFMEFCQWLCARLKPHNITALLEPFDTNIDKKYLYGPTRECVKLIESLKPDVDNLAIELDVAHLPLMGEDFADAIRTVAPYLKRVHLGNCVLKDITHPRYGDTHPPIGLPGGEIDTAELTEILKALLEVGFLDRHRRGSLLIEMTPWPGRTVDESVADMFSRLEAAWRKV
jgi:sugar phosphate isomerase/epimerase